MARDKEIVTKTMKRVKSKDTSIEVTLRKALWKKGFRYRKNCAKLPGKPDIVIPKYKIVIFCDSEFFHGKHQCTRGYKRYKEMFQICRVEKSDFPLYFYILAGCAD